MSIASDGDDEGVVVPPVELGLSDEHIIAALTTAVDPLGASHEFGVDLYLQAVQMILSFPDI